jgi:hypothetical protein
VIEAQVDTPKALRSLRTQYRPATPSQLVKRGRLKGTEAAKNDQLSIILAVIRGLKTSNLELKAEIRDLIEELAEVKT